MARMSAQTIRMPCDESAGLKMPANVAGGALPTVKTNDANPTLLAPAAWKTKSSARKARTIPAMSQADWTPGDLPDHTLVELRRRLAPVAGSATVWVVVLTPVRFDP